MQASVEMKLDVRDEQRLAAAIEKLEHQGLAMTIAEKVGMPVESLMRRLPEVAQRAVHTAVNRALEQCLRAALSGLNETSVARPANRIHQLAAGAAGAVGGFFGLAGLVVELPVSTTVMLHSIAEIARSHGEDLSDPANALGCLEVFALGSGGRAAGANSTTAGANSANTLESAYYATRAALAQATREAAAFVAQKGVAKGGAPVLVRFVSAIASRFGIEVAEKVTAQMVPIVGAAGGLALNVAFTSHFQRVAEGHFTVRALERRYGHALVQSEYGRLRLVGKK